MKVSRFQKWKNQLPLQISRFSIQADEGIGWEAVVHRHSAAEILVWIMNETGATLRRSQMVEAWFSIVRKCWNLMDIDRYSDRNYRMILDEIQYFVEKSRHKKEENVRQRAEAERKKQQKVLVTTISGGVRRTRRVQITDKSGWTEYFEKYTPPSVLLFLDSAN